jgi:hypothetical protein
MDIMVLFVLNRRFCEKWWNEIPLQGLGYVLYMLGTAPRHGVYIYISICYNKLTTNSNKQGGGALWPSWTHTVFYRLI